MVVQLDRDEARRIAVRAQLLDLPRPVELVEVVRRLTLVQYSPTAAVAPSADLVLWSRLGSDYRPEDLADAVEIRRQLFELDMMIRPIEDLELLLPGMLQGSPYPRTREWLEANEPFRQDVLERLRQDGPLSAREIDDTSVFSWPSSGWTNEKNVTQMLELLMMQGDIAVSGRDESGRLWDLAERVYPTVRALSLDEARRRRNERRLQALGIVSDHAPNFPTEPGKVGDAGEAAVIDGVPGTWRVDPAQLDGSTGPFAGRTVLLSPLDRLVYDRARTEAIFDFEFSLEMYKPKAKRRWGYFALPILHGDRLIGKVDATSDRAAGILRVDAIHEDAPFDSETADAVHAELEDLAGWLGSPAGWSGRLTRARVDRLRRGVAWMPSMYSLIEGIAVSRSR